MLLPLQCYANRQLCAPAILSHPVLNDVVMIPTQGPMGGVKPRPREVVVGLQCGEAVLRGADVFAPGLFGSPKGDSKHKNCLTSHGIRTL